MPHIPGHEYTFAGTDRKYNGKTVEAGGKLYSTTGNTIETTSQLLDESNTENTNMVNNGNQSMNTNRNQRANNNPVIATFVRGDNSQYDRTYYLPLNYSGNSTYGTAGGPVSNKTPLHRHQNRQTMLEHNMNNPVVVTTSRPRNVSTPRRQPQRNSGARSQGPRETTSNMSGRRNMTTPRGNGGRSTGGGY